MISVTSSPLLLTAAVRHGMAQHARTCLQLLTFPSLSALAGFIWFQQAALASCHCSPGGGGG